MDQDQIKTLVQTQIETQIIQAFRDAPEAIDELVKAALSKGVTEHGGQPRYSSDIKLSYLEWLVGETIRRVARETINEVVEERRPQIEAAIRKSITEGEFANEATSALMRMLNGEESWRCTINIQEEKAI